MLKFSKAEIIKNLILIGILVVVLLVFDLPMYSRIKAVYDRLAEEKELYSSKFQQGHSYDKFLADYKDYQAKLPLVESSFIPVGQELRLITKLEGLADRHHLSQTIDLSSSARQFADRVAVLGLELDLTGSYADLASYIEELEDSRFEVKITGLEIKKAGLAGLQINLLTDSYWLEE